MLFELLLLLALTLFNGLLAMAEMAVVSSKPVRLKGLIEQGRRGARRALVLAENPGRFLSTVQIGITLVGVIAGAFSGATLGGRLGEALLLWGVPAGTAEVLGMGVVVGLVTYLSLIVGELVPKQLALRAPEAIACALAPLLTTLATVAAPLVWVLEHSGRTIMKLLGQTSVPVQKVTDEEIHALMAEAERTGVMETDERQIIHRVMRLADKPVRAVMTPRNQIDMLDLDDDHATHWAQIKESQHSRFPVYRSNPEKILGVIWAKDLLMAGGQSGEQGAPVTANNWEELVLETPNIPDTMDALDAVDVLRQSPVHLGMVYDEYGVFVGVVTAADILEAIVGSFASSDPDERDEQPIVRREDGSLLVAGWVSTEDVHIALGLPHPADADYSTAAGLVIELHEAIPAVGEVIDYQGWRLEVVDKDGTRIDKILASRVNIK